MAGASGWPIAAGAGRTAVGLDAIGAAVTHARLLIHVPRWPAGRSTAAGAHVDVHLGRTLPSDLRGEQYWRAHHVPKLVRDHSGLCGNQVWECDHFRFDFWSRDRKHRRRLWCTIIIDRASNLPVGWAVTTNPSSDSLNLAIRRAVSVYGAPEKIVLDNGLDMASASFGNKQGFDASQVAGVFEKLGTAVQWCNAKSPWEKGKVEAFARTCHAHFDKRWPSYCGGSPGSRPEDVEQYCREHFAELPDRSLVEAAFGEWALEFSNRPSDAAGIAPLCPRERYESTRIAKRTMPDELLSILLLKSVAPTRVSSRGVRYQNLHYWDDRLFELQGKELPLLADPDDITFVWVCSERGKPLFKARQNLVSGTAEDARRGAARTRRGGGKSAATPGLNQRSPLMIRCRPSSGQSASMARVSLRGCRCACRMPSRLWLRS